MASGAKSFVINRKSDWEDESVITNLSFFKDTLISKNNGENGVYISSPFDSGQEGTVWHRLRMDMDLPSGGMVHTRLYASDDFEAFVPSNEGKKRVQIDVDKYIHSPDIDINRKIDMLDCIGAKSTKIPMICYFLTFKEDICGCALNLSITNVKEYA